MFSAQEATRKIQVLTGLPLVEVGRIGLTAILGFGQSLSWRLSKSGMETSGAEYAFHLQCPFRVRQGDRIILGSSDMRREGEVMPYDRGAMVLQDYAIEARPVITEILIQQYGDIRIDFQYGIVIEVFPAGVIREETWRFLHRFHDHYVFPDGFIAAE